MQAVASQNMRPVWIHRHKAISDNTRRKAAIIAGPQSRRAWLTSTGSVAVSASSSSAHAPPSSCRTKSHNRTSVAAASRIDGSRTVQTLMPNVANNGACSHAFTAPT